MIRSPPGKSVWTAALIQGDHKVKVHSALETPVVTAGTNPIERLMSAKKKERLRDRRSFLRPRTREVFPPVVSLIRAGRPAMATLFEVVFRARDRALMEHVHRALDRVQEIENQLSIFREDSEVSRVNREGDSKPVEVSPEVFQLIRRSRNLSEETRGAFDITASALWKCWGFYRRQGRIPEPHELEEARARCGYQSLELNQDENTVSLRCKGMELNLGSIGKGYALDRMAFMLQNAGLSNYLLHAGNSSFMAHGDLRESGTGWQVAIRDPRGRQPDFARIRLHDQGMATSGGSEQYFEYEGKRYGHVLDPRSGYPVHRYLSATAVAPDAETADALATAFFVMPRDEIERYCESHPDVGAVVLSETPEGELECFTLGRVDVTNDVTNADQGDQ